MKKILGLLIAVMMVTSIAFAAVTSTVTVYDSGEWIPGEVISITDQDVLAVDSTTNIKNISTYNYSVVNVKYNEGKKLVESVKINDREDAVEITLKQNYENTGKKNLDMTFTLRGKGKLDDVKINVIGTVAYNLDKTSVIIFDKDHVVIPYEFAKDTIYEIQMDNYKAGGVMEFTTANPDVEVAVRVYDGERYYLYSEVDPNRDILKKYGDTVADLDFLTFPAHPKFNAVATVIFNRGPRCHIYEIKDGNLVDAGATWSDDEGAFVLRTRTLGSYVISTRALAINDKVDTATTVVPNPDTGAHDVTGLAVALSAVAAISAAIVSLKKE